MKRVKIKIPIFDSTIIILQSEDILEVDQYISSVHNCPLELNGILNVEAIDGKVFTANEQQLYIWIREDATVFTLIHEIGHAVYNLMQYYDLEGEEIFLYLQGFILQSILCTKSEQMEALNHLSIVEDIQQ